MRKKQAAVGRARVGRSVGRAATPDRALTDVMRVGEPEAPPVFVDPSGVRRRRLRRMAYVVGTLLLLALLALWLSQFGGQVRPPAGDPCPSAVAGSAAPDAKGCRR